MTKVVTTDNQKSMKRKRKPIFKIISIIILLGFSIFSVWNFLQQQQQQNGCTDSRSSSSRKKISKNEEEEEEKKERFWKYYRTYRYIEPSDRFSYIPLPAKECGVGPNFDSWWKLNELDRSRNQEDKFIYETFFKEKKRNTTTVSNNDNKFTYVELGAFDGRQESNTRFFDICLGWEGLLIEGNPDNYQKTIANRPFAHKMSLAPSCTAQYEAINKTIPFYWYPMTNAGLVNHAKSYAGKPTVDVPCGPLSPILKDIFNNNDNNDEDKLPHNDSNTIPTIDFFSLDVEGSEDLVLSTIDFKAVRINILMIEIQNNFCQGKHCKVRQNVRAKMAEEGYKRYARKVKASDIYVHPKSPFTIK